ncbi:MAG: hypothetical protein ACTHOU_17330 [Aureliella sp.]|jgi:hypothetical protein
MENTIQPILCCVGAEVAGEPTQFLMERTCSAAHLDWRVITVEVSADALPQAWQGMSVMRFRAVRFFRAHQAAAMQLVGQASIYDRFIGGITSALRLADQWTMWHNSGPGLVEALTGRCRWADATCWLHGDSPRQRSIFVACTERPPRELIWSGCTTEIPDELAGRVPLELVGADREGEMAEMLAERMRSHPSENTLVHCGDCEPRHCETLIASQPSSGCDLVVVSQSPGTRRKLSDQWRAGQVQVITPADIVVAEEAYDQARWIGRPANLELLREAYEEYADF